MVDRADRDGSTAAVVRKGDDGAAAARHPVRGSHRPEESHRPGDAGRGDGTRDRRIPHRGENGARKSLVAAAVDCRSDRGTGAKEDCAIGNDLDRDCGVVKVSRMDCVRGDGCYVRESANDRGRDRIREEVM